ncbi:MAG TPA: phage baseplate assembly protein V [Stellaceae bacterium]|nr:phage baseplate assembly protein V [Stellaceae bacterium]
MSEARQSDTYPGIYSATVTTNTDPKMKGRLLLTVPDVLSYSPSTWAEPSVPLAGPTGPSMGAYMVPPVGAGVWVMFQRGDPDRPVWIGCRWGDTPTGVPTMALAGNPADPNIVIQSLLQHMVMISDMPPSPATGGIILQSATGATIVVNDSGIYISNGKGASITMVGPTINFNTGAMTIT